MPHKIIFDTDPGIDDAMAILLGLQSPEIEFVGLTTIFGNVWTHQATDNALRLLELAGRHDIPVAHGAEKPLLIPFDQPAHFVHGSNGLGEVQTADPTGKPDPRSAAQFIVETVMANPGEITLVPVGPLTNIALALLLEPKIVANVKEVVLMGGAGKVNGNVNPAAEANIWHDPHAADRVFTAKWPVTMVGLDVTTKPHMNDEYLASLQGSRFGDFIWEISRFYIDFHEKYAHRRACDTHDPSAIVYLIDPSLFSVQRGPIRVVCEGVALGMTVWDHHGGYESPSGWTGMPPVNVCVDVESDRVLELFRQRIRRDS